MFAKIISSVSFKSKLPLPHTRQSVRNFIRETKPSDAISAETQNAEAEVKLSMKERIKGKIRDAPKNVTNYLKMVKYDYSEALKEVTDFYRAKPIKASFFSAVVSFGLYAAHTNPDEKSYWDSFVDNSQELSLLGDPIRNPDSERLVNYVSRAYNAGLVRRLNLGVVSLMWVDNYDAGMGLYASQCDYLKPTWADMRHRVVDVGFLGEWWITKKKMETSDVNAEEWNEDGSPVNKGTQLQRMW